MTGEAKHWAVVPAAGVGRRMGARIPKQYLDLAGRTVLDHTLSRLLSHPRIAGIAVALGSEDGWWPDSEFADHPAILRVTGGAERCHSVLNGLIGLARSALPDDWVLVHDAARPCLRWTDIDRLIATLADHPVGGLLGVPVRDTMKRTDETGTVQATVDRDGLWHAYTPQMFRHGMLRAAIENALALGRLVTDEASAVEMAGHAPLMVEGHDDNLKVTRPADLALAEFYLQRQADTDPC
jgi:2-C-methyl-D-erythritol 4-phosphate cytidylyltransferase